MVCIVHKKEGQIKELNYKFKTDYPVATIVDEKTEGKLMYFKQVSSQVSPPLKVRKLFEKYCIAQPEYGEETECEHLNEKVIPVFRKNERIIMFIAGCQNCGEPYCILKSSG